jgi:hypothetical protein
MTAAPTLVTTSGPNPISVTGILSAHSPAPGSVCVINGAGSSASPLFVRTDGQPLPIAGVPTPPFIGWVIPAGHKANVNVPQPLGNGPDVRIYARHMNDNWLGIGTTTVPAAANSPTLTFANGHAFTAGQLIVNGLGTTVGTALSTTATSVTLTANAAAAVAAAETLHVAAAAGSTSIRIERAHPDLRPVDPCPWAFAACPASTVVTVDLTGILGARKTGTVIVQTYYGGSTVLDGTAGQSIDPDAQDVLVRGDGENPAGANGSYRATAAGILVHINSPAGTPVLKALASSTSPCAIAVRPGS